MRRTHLLSGDGQLPLPTPQTFFQTKGQKDFVPRGSSKGHSSKRKGIFQALLKSLCHFASGVTTWYTENMPPKPPASSASSTSASSKDVRRITGRIVYAYRKKLGSQGKLLPLMQFAEALSESVAHLHLHVSYQTIKNWEDGIHRPDYFFTMQLASHAPAGSWQRAFALDILSVQWPKLYPPGSEIGERYTKELLQSHSIIP